MDAPPGAELFYYTRGVTVRKKLQWLGNSRVLLLDRSVLRRFLPDGDYDQELLVTVQRGELVVRPADARPAEPDTTAAKAPLLPFEELTEREQAILRALADGPANTTEVAQLVGGVSVSMFSRHLNALARAGWLRKTGRDWHLTAAGRAAVRAVPT